MKKNRIFSRVLSGVLAGTLALSLSACGGSSGHATAPPEDGLPSRIITDQVGRIAQRPNSVLKAVNTIPAVNIVNAPTAQDVSSGIGSTASARPTTKHTHSDPSAAYPAVNAIRSPGLSSLACTLSWIEKTYDYFLYVVSSLPQSVCVGYVDNTLPSLLCIT